MTKTYSHTFDSHVFKGTVEIPTGIFINGQWKDGSEGKTIECVARDLQRRLILELTGSRYL
jgi:aldehyde dehydrogenase (NAD+)